MSRNILFPLYLTRALLPSLRRTSQRGPVVIFALGSLSSEVAPPYLSVYASSKKFLETLLRCLAADDRFTASLFPSRPKEDVRFKYIQVGSVNSATNKTPVSLTVPSTVGFARDCLRRVHAPGRVVCASLVHAVQLWAVSLIGERKAEEEAGREMRSMHGERLLAQKTE
jgi:17beta-estradiol 17-dehydrogenase / very-long-chain 3-oxoacyl-CoA reductase